MARYSIPQAKNFVSRCLRNIIDPVPSPKDRLAVWEHFGNQCAYCGAQMEPGSRIGHLDHLVPATQGGTNHISNFVLACPGCNGDDKREQKWESFLKEKAGDAFKERHSTISAWINRELDSKRQLSSKEVAILDRVSNEVKEAISRAADELREIRK